ncbi:MAG: hypothetical protein RLZ12_361, partial [Bacillota bacterium]
KSAVESHAGARAESLVSVTGALETNVAQKLRSSSDSKARATASAAAGALKEVKSTFNVIPVVEKEVKKVKPQIQIEEESILPETAHGVAALTLASMGLSVAGLVGVSASRRRGAKRRR